MGGNLKILLVDDNPMILGMLRHELAELAPVTTAVNGADALAAAIETPPDLIISDYNMPELNGTSADRKVEDASGDLAHSGDPVRHSRRH